MDQNLDKNAQIFNQLEKIILSGKEDEAKKFLVDNFNSFPEEFQREIVLAKISEGLDLAIHNTLLEGEKKNRSALEVCEALKEVLP